MISYLFRFLMSRVRTNLKNTSKLFNVKTGIFLNELNFIRQFVRKKTSDIQKKHIDKDLDYIIAQFVD